MSSTSTSNASRRVAIGRRPAADPASEWVHKDEQGSGPARATPYTARLTIDVTPGLRGRIKLAALRRSMTAADMLRALLEREFPENAP
jgi:hypothetical protein